MAGGKMKLSILSYFFISFVLDGLLRLSGLFVLELLQSTDLSRQDAVVPFILSWVVSNIVASFSSILNENKYSGYIILFGILLCATGAALCIFASSLTTLIVYWGLLFGSGYGLAYPHLSIRLKIENRDKLSSVLQMTPSLGATIMPFVFSILTPYYALQGSFLIFCGIILNYLPLAVAAAHDFEISIPNIKWRVRKKSSQYSVSKYEERKSISVESFINSLEPDLILDINQTNTIQDEDKIECCVMITPVTEIPPIGRKRSETRGNDLQGFDSRLFPRNKSPSRLYENDRNIFEENIAEENGIEEREPNINYDTMDSVEVLEKNTPNCEVNSDLNLKCKILDKITEQEIEDNAYENNELGKDCCETCNSYENNILISTSSALQENEIDQPVHENNSLISTSKLSQSEIEYNVDKINSSTSPNTLLESHITQNVNERNDPTSTCGISESEIEQNIHESNSLTSTNELIECQIIQNIDESSGFTSACGFSENEIKQKIRENNNMTSPSELIECQIIQNVDESNGLTSSCGLSENEIKQNIHESNSLTSPSDLIECKVIHNVEGNGLTSPSELIECKVIHNVEGNGLTSTCGLPRSDIKQNVNENKAISSISNTFPTCDRIGNKDVISSQTEQAENLNYQTDEKSDTVCENQQKADHPRSLNSSPPTNKKLMQSVKKENILLSPNSLKTKHALSTSMVIKIHVEECTFTTDEKQWAKNFNRKMVKSTKDSHIKHSKPVKLDMHEHKLLDNQKISKRLSKCSKLCKSKLSDIYSISEKCDNCDKIIHSEKMKHTEKMCSNQMINVQRIVKYLEITTSRVWLSILLMSVIFEINLVTLLIIFADLGSDVDNISSDFKWILVAFGVGGFIGKICCCKISRVIPEKYHAIGVVLFLLNGLTTAGILYSSTLNWLAGFYCILGALEGGITYIIPKFISEYIDEDVHSSLTSVKCFFSGVAIMCIPYGIGLFRDDMGDYEFLLEILSCSSILCAFLAYFLPHLISTSHKQSSAF